MVSLCGVHVDITETNGNAPCCIHVDVAVLSFCDLASVCHEGDVRDRGVRGSGLGRPKAHRIEVPIRHTCNLYTT